MPNTALPPAIQRQLDEAAAIERQVYGDPAPAQLPVTAPANTEVAPESVAADGQTAPQPVAPEPQATEVLTVPSVDAEEEKFARRYEVLQNKYNAEVPRLHAQLREAANNIAYLTGEVARLSQIQQSAPVPPAPTIQNDDAERFGDDLVAAIDRRAREIATQMFNEQAGRVVNEVNTLRNQLNEVGQRVEVTDQDRFYGALQSLVPSYQQINADPGFLAWLAEPDPVYGVPRQAALDHAANNLDAKRVASIFQTYNSLTREHVGEQARGQSRKQLERQVAPPTTTASAAPTPSGKIWTRADYEHAYDPRNHQRVGAEEAARMMAEADQAYAEGRIRW